jgi:hypothetical protein
VSLEPRARVYCAPNGLRFSARTSEQVNVCRGLAAWATVALAVIAICQHCIGEEKSKGVNPGVRAPNESPREAIP